MDGFFLATSTSSTSGNACGFRLCVPSFSNFRNYRTNISLLPRKPINKLLVFTASEDVPELDKWEQMELKFGRLIGEDPKLTLAKVIGRKSNPDLSFLDIEKSYKNKGNAGFSEIEELPLDVSDIRKPSTKGKSGISEIKEVPRDVSDIRKPSTGVSGLNLVRPVPKKGVRFETNDKPSPRAPSVKRPSQPVAKTVDDSRQSNPGISLRKPTSFFEDNVGGEKSLGLSEEWNLSVKMGESHNQERLSETKLVRKPHAYVLKNEEEASQKAEATVSNAIEENNPTEGGASIDVTLLQKPEISNLDLNDDQKQDGSAKAIEENNSMECGTFNYSLLQKPEILNLDLNGDLKQEDPVGQTQSKSDISTEMVHARNINLDQSLESGDTLLLRDHSSSLQGQPKRLDRSVERKSTKSGMVTSLVNLESSSNGVEHENFSAKQPMKEPEVTDWARAENLIKVGEREFVELTRASIQGFAVSFGSLIGFLPYRNLAMRWRYIAFESWLRRKGLDPSKYKQNLGIVGKYEATSPTMFFDSSLNSKSDSKIVVEGEISPDTKLEDLLVIYDQEKLKHLSSFVGQKVRVYVVLADRESRKLIFSTKQKEKEDSIEKKKRLMSKLSVGDVVKCCINDMTYFGIFVEVEGVPALIHQSEVTWDATSDPLANFRRGQVIEARVHQLDFSLGRIYLSLKDIMPDPLIETLESVVRHQAPLEAEADTEWSDVDSLVKELQQYEGIQSTSKGRYFLSPGLAPTFQVYLASTFEDHYKLLARSGNKVQEVIVKTSLNKEQMKTAILTCANRVT